MLKFSELKRIPLRDKWKNEGLEMQPEFAEELDRRIADYEAGRAKLIPMEKVFNKLGNCSSNRAS